MFRPGFSHIRYRAAQASKQEECRKEIRGIELYVNAMLNSHSLPLDKSLVLATDGEETRTVGSEGSTDDMLTMTAVGFRFCRVVNARVVVHINKAPIVTRDYNGAIRRTLDLVNVSAIFAGGVNTLDVPT